MLDSPIHQTTADPAYSDKDNLIRYIYGWDAYDDDMDSTYNEKREYILGDILHSQPLIIDYTNPTPPTSPQRVIFFGANDGMLHAIDDSDGTEKWAFIPPDLLPKLKNIVEGSNHSYFVDSSPKAYIKDVDKDGNIESGDQVIIVFGERRGGTSYCALDVTNPDEPKYLWRIDNANSTITGIPNPTTVISAMGQTWSEPIIGKGKVGAAVKNVAIVGGGYSTDNLAGCALYVINIDNGQVLKNFTSSNHPNLTKSIPSTVLAVDTTFDGYINRVYVGDLGGQMWRFGYHRTSSSDTTPEDGEITQWTPRLLFNTNESPTDKRKIFYPPDLVLERGYAYLYFGTGDREDPMKLTLGATGSGFYDAFYAVKDRNTYNPYTTLMPSNLINVTTNLLQDPTATEAEKAALRASLLSGNGWYVMMENDGEKVLAPPTVIFGTLLFTTFTPIDTTLYPCSYGGDGRVYALNYLTAEAVLDMDMSGGDLTKGDRSLKIGHGIPTEVVIVITPEGDIWPLIGVGGGVVGGGSGGGGGGGGPPGPLPGPKRNFDINSWYEVR